MSGSSFPGSPHRGRGSAATGLASSTRGQARRLRV